MPPLARIYLSTARPLSWIVQAEGAFWLVPHQPGGWHARTPYQGDTAHLRRLTGDKGIASLKESLGKIVSPTA